jgi:threonine/homoserine/homoserine lactone efflux protein
MLAGHSSILDKPSVLLVLRIVSVAVIALLGIRYLLAKTVKLELSAATVERVDQRWHHPRSFLLGFILTISNLMLVLIWATLAALLFARDWVQPELASRAACIAGVFTGGALWFFLLAFFVSRAHRRVKPKTLTALVRASGIVFLLFAGLLAYKLFYPTPPGHRVDLIHHTP